MKTFQMLLFKKQQKDTDFLVTPKLLFSNPTKQTDKKEYKPSKNDLVDLSSYSEQPASESHMLSAVTCYADKACL